MILANRERKLLLQSVNSVLFVLYNISSGKDYFCDSMTEYSVLSGRLRENKCYMSFLCDQAVFCDIDILVCVCGVFEFFRPGRFHQSFALITLIVKL